MRVTRLVGGKRVAFDSCDLPLFQGARWRILHGAWPYLVTSSSKTTQRRFHREVVGARPGEIVDHIDGDCLNNCRANLRICTEGENRRNRRPNRGNRFKGVYFLAGRGCWRAHVTHQNKKINLGNFSTPEDAAAAYDSAAKKLHGEFARLNFPETKTEAA